MTCLSAPTDVHAIGLVGFPVGHQLRPPASRLGDMAAKTLVVRS